LDKHFILEFRTRRIFSVWILFCQKSSVRACEQNNPERV